MADLPRRSRRRAGNRRQPRGTLTNDQIRERARTQFRCVTCWAWWKTDAARQACDHRSLEGNRP